MKTLRRCAYSLQRVKVDKRDDKTTVFANRCALSDSDVRAMKCWFYVKQFQECLSELTTHSAVQDKVDPVVDQSRDVHDVTERYVKR